MEPNVQISFLVDEHLPVRLLLPILEGRGHRVTPVVVQSADAAILTRAEQTAPVIITADTWFLEELFRYPPGHRRCYTRAGVIQVPGARAMARLRLTNDLPIIEALCVFRGTQPDRRVAIDLSRRVILIPEPSTGSTPPLEA
jgi:hypothetical protein